MDNPAYLYCAGLFEGEGTFGCSIESLKSGNIRKRLYLSIGMTNRQPLDLFEDIMQIGNVKGPYQYKTGSPYWRYNLSNTSDIKHAVSCMWDWLSDVRKLQWKKALELYEAD